MKKILLIRQFTRKKIRKLGLKTYYYIFCLFHQSRAFPVKSSQHFSLEFTKGTFHLNIHEIINIKSIMVYLINSQLLNYVVKRLLK